MTKASPLPWSWPALLQTFTVISKKYIIKDKIKLMKYLPERNTVMSKKYILKDELILLYLLVEKWKKSVPYIGLDLLCYIHYSDIEEIHPYRLNNINKKHPWNKYSDIREIHRLRWSNTVISIGWKVTKAIP